MKFVVFVAIVGTSTVHAYRHVPAISVRADDCPTGIVYPENVAREGVDHNVRGLDLVLEAVKEDSASLCSDVVDAYGAVVLVIPAPVVCSMNPVQCELQP